MKLKAKEGQSLIEILIAVGIGGLVIGAATYAISFILASNTTNQQRQIATGLGEGLMSKVRVIADADWLDIYNLPTKSATSTYFVVASSSELIVVEGKEGMLSDDVGVGLVGHWKFDEATTTTSTITYDSSGNKNNGILTNGPTRATSTCKISYCLSFDGSDDYVDLPDGIVQNATDFTFVAWVNWSGGSAWQRIFDFGTGTTVNMFLTPKSAKAGFLGLEFAITTNGGNNEQRLAKGTDLASGFWKHVAVVLSGDTGILYEDGVNVASGTITLNPSDLGSTNSNWFGKSQYVADPTFNGKIDEVRIYNRALSADEIQHLYNSTVYSRYFSVENVQRDTSDNIVTSGGTDDPSTQKITVNVEWSAGGGTPLLQIIDYVTRWKNRVFNQSDWSGGSGQEGPLTEPNDKYASSTNIDATSTPGSIKIKL